MDGIILHNTESVQCGNGKQNYKEFIENCVYKVNFLISITIWDDRVCIVGRYSLALYCIETRTSKENRQCVPCNNQVVHNLKVFSEHFKRKLGIR